MTRYKLLIISQLIGCLAAAASARGQSPVTPDDRAYLPQSLRAVANAPDKTKYQGSTRCQRCHASRLTDADRLNGVSNRVCLTEALFWKEADHHADAYTALSANGGRGERIGQLLNADVMKPETGCVQCHAPSFAVTTVAAVKEGVNCEVCHGPSSEWVGEHDSLNAKYAPTWPSVPLEGPAGKTELGWIDVRSPVTRAELCVSCHVGSAQHERVITHAMYAAGHPPLSGFEVESFADQMPRHWRYANEKKGNAAVAERTKNLLVGSIVVLRMAVELAAADAAAPPNSGRWPELARLDCYACHHELEPTGARAVQVGLPGRPPLIVGCVPLIRVAAKVAIGTQAGDELDLRLAKLQAAFKSNPFGDPGKLTQEAASVAAWCRPIEDRLEATEFKTPQIREVLRQIAEEATLEYRDYDSARQLLGAWTVIYGELPQKDAAALSDEQRQRIDSLLATASQKWPQLTAPGSMTITCGAGPPQKRDFNTLLAQHFSNRDAFAAQDFSTLMSQLASIVGQKQ